MRITDADLDWLAEYAPGLRYDAAEETVTGALGFYAAYNRRSERLEYGNTAELRSLPTFVADSFEIKIDLLDTQQNGWPRLYETDGRGQEIAGRNDYERIDLHFFEDGACCLGIRYAPERNPTLQRFVLDLVIPFLYRLAYTDRHGLEAAREDLWDEYSHGDEGHDEYIAEILQIVGANPGRNDRCPCGSGEKYKRCHMDEVEAVKRL